MSETDTPSETPRETLTDYSQSIEAAQEADLSEQLELLRQVSADLQRVLDE